MAYFSQERKAQLAPEIKKVCAQYGIKATIGVRHHSTLVINIKSGKLDVIGNYMEVCKTRNDYGTNVRGEGKAAPKYLDINPYWYDEHFSGKVKSFFNALFAIANKGNHDNSDIQSDYFDVGWYVDVNVGNWEKPYEVTK